MLPLAYPVVPLIRRCIKVVRLHVLPVASVAVVEATLVPSTNKFERSSVAPKCNRMPASVERRSTGKATCHDGAIASGLSNSLRRWLVLAYVRPVVGC